MMHSMTRFAFQSVRALAIAGALFGCSPETNEKPAAYVPYPVQVSGLTRGFVDVAHGGSSTCALHENGDVYCWGAADFVEPGLENHFATKPVRVDVPPMKALISGNDILMLTRTGSEIILLGAGRLYENAAPPGLRFIAPTEDGAHDQDTNCVFVDSGELRCNNLYYQFGDPITKIAPNVRQIAFNGPGSYVAVIDDGEVVCAGIGQCGLSYLSTEVAPKGYGSGPTLAEAPRAIHVSLGCLVGEDKLVYCWGRNSWGQLGTGATGWFDGKWRPALHVTNAKRVVATFTHTCAITESKQLWCWGSNSVGQLGIGYVSVGTCPELVDGVPLVHDPVPHSCAFGVFEPQHVLNDVEDVALTYGNTCVVLTGGSVKCWGRQDHGFLGNGVLKTE